MEHIGLLLRGFGGNLLITAISVGLLVIPGFLLTLLAKKFPVVGKIFGWLSIPCECICPVVMILCLYYLMPGIRVMLGGVNVYNFFVSILGLTIAYMGYMPARFVPEYSLWKNVFYNGLGMIAAIFKWSFCVFIIGCPDLLFYAKNILNRTFRSGIYWVPLVVSFLSLLGIEILRRMIKQFMK